MIFQALLNPLRLATKVNHHRVIQIIPGVQHYGNLGDPKQKKQDPRDITQLLILIFTLRVFPNLGERELELEACEER